MSKSFRFNKLSLRYSRGSHTHNRSASQNALSLYAFALKSALTSVSLLRGKSVKIFSHFSAFILHEM